MFEGTPQSEARERDDLRRKVKYICPECGIENGTFLKCVCVVGADESISGYTERLYYCPSCYSCWGETDIPNNRAVIKRYHNQAIKANLRR